METTPNTNPAKFIASNFVSSSLNTYILKTTGISIDILEETVATATLYFWVVIAIRKKVRIKTAPIAIGNMIHDSEKIDTLSIKSSP
jgi:hydrogenase/urease accessory protein HupE